MREAVVVSAVRTAVGKAPRGTLKNTRPDDMAAAVQKLHGTVPVVIKRDGQTMTKYVDITQRQRWVTDGAGGAKPSTIGVMGVMGTSTGPTHRCGGRGPISLNARGSSPLPSARTQQRDGKA